LAGGFGSAVLELACDRGWDTRLMRRLGIPDSYAEHGDRAELLADMGMSVEGIVEACREMSGETAGAL
jgi:1-deoxy-D-xylulose-5-phosphate synthase